MRQGVKHTIKKNTSHYLTCTVVGWIDVFTRTNHKDAIIDALRYCIKNKGLNVYAYCLMTNHLHLIVNCNDPFELKDVIRDFKRHTAKMIMYQIKNEPESRREWMFREFENAGSKGNKFWQSGNHAIELYNERFTWHKINYIHDNPVKAGFIKNASDWRYSSASNYFELESILEEVYCIPRRLTTLV